MSAGAVQDYLQPGDSLEIISDPEMARREFREQFIQDPGGHLISPSITGSGKTNRLKFLVECFVQWSNETILWIDCGKSEEFLGLLALGRPLNLILPVGCDVTLRLMQGAHAVEWAGEGAIAEGDIEIKKSFFTTPRDIWRSIERGYINILIVQPFFIGYEDYSRFVARLFRELIYDAHHNVFERLGILPLAIFSDEFQDICPSKAIALDDTHLRAAKLIAFNLKKLRSIGIRIVAAAQSWVEVHPSARRSFNWILCGRHAFFERDQPKLMRFNDFWQCLETPYGVLVYPNRIFPGVWEFPYYGKGSDYGSVRYIGTLGEEAHYSSMVKELTKAGYTVTPPGAAAEG